MDWLKELLGEELYAQVVGKLGDKKLGVISDGSYIPKAKFDEKNEEVKTLKTQLGERDTQLSELKVKAAGSDELQKQIGLLQEANTAATAELQKKLDQQAFEFALEKSLTNAGTKNAKAAKALLDISKIKLDGETLLGLDEQLTALKKSDEYLFNTAGAGNGTGGGGGNPFVPNQQQKNPYVKGPDWNLTEQWKLELSNPTLASQMQAAAGITS